MGGVSYERGFPVVMLRGTMGSRKNLPRKGLPPTWGHTRLSSCVPEANLQESLRKKAFVQISVVKFEFGAEYGGGLG